jgi:uncharacterized protein YkwD
VLERPILCALAAVLWAGAHPRLQPERERVAAAIVRLTNAERTRAGVSQLEPNASLMQAAQLHADSMSRLRRLEHDLPGARYPKLKDRLKAAGYEWRAVAENISFGHETPARTVAGWMRSAGHRKNLLDKSYRETGVGFARDSAGKPYYVQVFARPE